MTQPIKGVAFESPWYPGKVLPRTGKAKIQTIEVFEGLKYKDGHTLVKKNE